MKSIPEDSFAHFFMPVTSTFQACHNSQKLQSCVSTEKDMGLLYNFFTVLVGSFLRCKNSVFGILITGIDLLVLM